MTRPRPGRPRHAPDESGDRSPREQILEAAAALFVDQGFSATSTRAIADRVGIRQASLYYHFAGKDDILLELLCTSVRPSLDTARALEDAAPEAALYALAMADAHTLATAPHNIGMLYLLPEVQLGRYDMFREDRAELQDTYARLGAKVAGEDPASAAAARRGEMLIQLVEVVIHQRRTRVPDTSDCHAIAEACLRVCGADQRTIAAARADAAGLTTSARV
ncbi:TetR/AcrR family transcriptional regulator [Lentzea indica]|uniref:TetR/AcrR family transcriptional regulator n=1 Tax=Lentzea indica TaxID=2604800 RepID=UPI001CB6DE99|nr:TetR/AcrR family transcriptional regulator [Lentzea indica]